ncbi:hypothetical protein [Actinomadura atramentaria]|uniref:hypothetical protein n=1 Tax=Actinomadura atramentaria TaxID=1990 RepID=UPI00036F787B|nr:hypothetical protein [Actinomadura atramentaria]
MDPLLLGLLIMVLLYAGGLALAWGDSQRLKLLADVLFGVPLVGTFGLIWWAAGSTEPAIGAVAIVLFFSVFVFLFVGAIAHSGRTAVKGFVSGVGFVLALIGSVVASSVEKSWSKDEGAHAVPCTVTVLIVGHTRWVGVYNTRLTVNAEGHEPFRTDNSRLEIDPAVAANIVRGNDTFSCRMSRKNNEKLRINWARHADPLGSTAPNRTAAGDVASLRNAATALLAAYSAGDYGSAWDRWSTSALHTITRPDYLKLYDLCPAPNEGIPYEITAARIENTTGIVRAQQAGTTSTFRFIWEDEAWRYVLPTTTAREYRTDVKRLAARRAKQGRCATPHTPN